MARVVCSFEEQAGDQRSFEFAYQFKIENHGLTAIKLITTQPRLGKGATVVEVQNPTADAATARHVDICRELSKIVNELVTLQSENVRKGYANGIVNVLDEMISTKMVVRMYLNFFRSVYMRTLTTSAAKAVMEMFTLRVGSYGDAEDFYERFVKDHSDLILKNIYHAKMTQLDLAEKKRDSIEGNFIALIEPDSFFAETYILRCPRKALEPAKFTVTIEASFLEDGKPEEVLGSAAATIVVSPNPLVLTAVAILGGILGASLRYSLEASKSFKWQDLIYGSLLSASGLESVIAAILFFNIYEYTEWGKKITMGVGWRSAMLVGSLCGLFADRVMAALKGFTVPS